jgi:hypothetical protein
LEERKTSNLLYLTAAQGQVDTRAKKKPKKSHPSADQKLPRIGVLKKKVFRVLRRCLLLLTAALPRGRSGHSEAKYPPFSCQSA